MLRHRLATAAVAIPLLLLLILRGPSWLFAAVVGSIAFLGVVEYVRMAFHDRAGDRFVFTLLGAAIVAGTSAYEGRFLGASLAVTITGGLLWVLFARRDFSRGLTDLGHALLGILYAGYLLPHFIWLRDLPDGPYWVIFVIMNQMAGDSAGYFAGHAVGRHKLAPSISPGKTLEGAAGIFAGNMVVGAVTKLLLLPQLGWAEVLLLAVGQGTLGQLGDLCESMMKRTFGTKESGGLFPGHGGVLDRIDSLVFPVAAVCYYVSICR